MDEFVPIKLDPCPKCGGEAKFEIADIIEVEDGFKTPYCVWCENCSIATPYDENAKMRDAAETWNCGEYQSVERGRKRTSS